jgi:hypothetical protein
MASIFRSDINVTGQAQGIPGPQGVAGIITIGAGFALPANALESIVTLNSTTDVLADGQSIYGVLPENIPVRLRRSGSQYFVKSLFKRDVVSNFPANTRLYISGDQAILAIAADATIGISGPTAIQIEPNPLAIGSSFLATVGPIAGVISRDSANTYFAPTFPLSSPFPLNAFVHGVVIGSEKSQNPLNVGNVTLTEKNGDLEISGDIRLINQLTKIFPLSQLSGYVFVVEDSSVALGVTNEGTTEIATLTIPDVLTVARNYYRNEYIYTIHDIVSQLIAFAIRDDGAVEVAELSIPKTLDMSYNSSTLDDFVVYDSRSKSIALSVENGKTSIEKLIDKNLGVASTTADGATVFYSKLVDDESQIFSLVIATNTIKQLTWVGNNTSPQYNATLNKIFFVSDRTGNSEPYDMDLNGTNQSRVVNRAEVLQIYRHGIEWAGQSNSVNADGVTPIDTTQPYNNTKLLDSSGNYTTVGGTLSYTPLIEPMRPIVGGGYPQNISGYGLATAMGNVISGYMGATFRVHAIQTGRGGASLAEISEGTGFPGDSYPGGSWAAGLFEANALKALATAESKTYDIGCLILVNGESDAGLGTVDFGKKLSAYLKRYNQTRKAVTGQKRDIPMILFQQHTFCQTGGGYPPVVTEEQFLAPKIDPLIYVAGPRYQYDNVPEGPAANPSGVHHSTYGFRAIGIKAGQVAKAVYVDGWWRPLEPISAKAVGNIIRIKFHVPYPGLNFDPNIVQPTNIINSANPWINAKGFEAYDATGANIGLIAARIHSPTEVDIETSLTDAGKVATIRYAQSTAANTSVTWSGAVHPANREQGRRGALRDSDPFVGPDLVTINCNVANGSANITSVAANGFSAKVGKYYMAIAASLSTDTIVSTRTSDSALVLSQPWTGATGTANIQFRSEQRNYCVAFKISVPYQE